MYKRHFLSKQMKQEKTTLIAISSLVPKMIYLIVFLFSLEIFSPVQALKTKLHQAAIKNDIKAIEKLLSNKNCDSNALDKKGKTALAYALEYGYKEIEKRIIAHNKRKGKKCILFQDSDICLLHPKASEGMKLFYWWQEEDLQKRSSTPAIRKGKNNSILSCYLGKIRCFKLLFPPEEKQQASLISKYNPKWEKYGDPMNSLRPKDCYFTIKVDPTLTKVRLSNHKHIPADECLSIAAYTTVSIKNKQLGPIKYNFLEGNGKKTFYHLKTGIRKDFTIQEIVNKELLAPSLKIKELGKLKEADWNWLKAVLQKNKLNINKLSIGDFVKLTCISDNKKISLLDDLLRDTPFKNYTTNPTTYDSCFIVNNLKEYPISFTAEAFFFLL